MDSFHTFFDIALPACVITIMLSAGVLSEPKVLVEYFNAQHLKLTMKVVVLNILVIPAISFLLLLTVPMNTAVGLLIFLISIAPAAPMVPTMVHINRGDINWALVLLFVLTVISLFTIPLMLHIGQRFLADKFVIDIVTGKELLKGYVLPVFPPLAIGFLLKLFARKIAEKIAPAINLLVMLSNLIIILLVIGVNINNFGSMEVWPSLGLVFFVGLCALSGGVAVYPKAQDVEYVTAVITTGLRNFAIVLLLINIMTDDTLILMYTIPVSLVPLFVCLIRVPFLSAKNRAVKVHNQ